MRASVPARRSFREGGGQRPPSHNQDFWFTYILECSDGTFYVGKTKEINQRLDRHAKGQVVYTSSRLPVKLIVYLAFPDEWTAVRMEKYLKSDSGRAFAKKHFLRTG